MPLYEYKCDNCGTEFEVRRPISASDDPAPCPMCASRHPKRQLSLFTAFSKGNEGSLGMSGGCGCDGACACGRNHIN